MGYKRLGMQVNKKLIHPDNGYKNNLLHNFYHLLKTIPFHPGHIIDVGAHRGTWMRATLKEFPGCIFTLLEPQAEMEECIRDILD